MSKSLKSNLPASTRATRGWHHAYLIVGPLAESEKLFARMMEDLDFPIVGNPDFYSFKGETLGIEDARDVGDRASRKAFGERKVFLIRANRYTHEAQNALLKTLEDPTPDTHFFILVQSTGELIPTLLSRMQIERTEARDRGRNTDVEKFLSLNPAKRILFAKKFSDDEKSLVGFLDDLLVCLKEKNASSSILSDIHKLRRFASDRSAQSRLVLEHLALVL